MNTGKEIPLEDFFRAYYDCRKNKRGTMNALAFEMNYEERLVELYREVRERRYEIGKSIAFVITKPKLREVFAADFRDRIIHHLVMRKIEPLFEEVFIDDSYNCRVGKGNFYGLNRLRERLLEAGQRDNQTYIGKFDMQGFFMSIHKPTLWEKTRRFVSERYKGSDKEAVLYLLEKIILHNPESDCIKKSPAKMWELLPKNKSLFTVGGDYGLPIGNLSSQMLANFYLSGFDEKMNGILAYGRYVDDFYLIGRKADILRAVSSARGMLSAERLRLHPRKWYLQHWTKGVSFLGGACKMCRFYVGKRTVHNARKAVEEINGIKDKQGYCTTAMQRINSYLGYMGHFDSYTIRRRLISMLDKEWLRYFYFTNSAKKAVLREKYKEKTYYRNLTKQWRTITATA